MKAKKRILVFPFDLLSHYLRCTVLINDHFKRDEYDSFFLHSSRYGHYPAESGYNTFDCEQFDAEKVMACSEKFDFSWLNERDLERILLAQIKAIEELKPDIVIGDVAPTLKMAAEITGVQYIALTNGYMTRHYAYTRKLSRTHPAYKYSKKVPEKYFNIITAFAERISFRIVHRPLKKLRRKYRLKHVADYLSEMEGDENLICDLPELFPQGKLPSNYKLINPLMCRSANQENWLQNLPSKKPIIFVCMGSTGNWDALSFLNDVCFDPFTFITAGDKGRVLSASHIISHDFVNMDAVLDVASLMICHGGNGTIYHGLFKNVYMLCLTSHFEQEWNVHALERFDYGCSANNFTKSDWEANISIRTLKNKSRASEHVDRYMQV